MRYGRIAGLSLLMFALAGTVQATDKAPVADAAEQRNHALVKELLADLAVPCHDGEAEFLDRRNAAEKPSKCGTSRPRYHRPPCLPSASSAGPKRPRSGVSVRAPRRRAIRRPT